MSSDNDFFKEELSLKVNGLKVLDRSRFSFETSIPSIQCNVSSCAKLVKSFKHFLFRRPALSSVVSHDTDTKAILLSPSILKQEPFSETHNQLLKAEGAHVSCRDVSLSYENFSSSEILFAVMSGLCLTVPSAFETIGHIAHLNLAKDHFEFRNLIGQVILDKNAHIKTVVNKASEIANEFRFFSMELIAGEDSFLASVREHGCTFDFDFSKVYWNSRLQTEHKYMADLVKPCDIVMDVFAGVGPFTVPIAKKGCQVFANDLNTDSFYWLGHNVNKNKVQSNVKTFNMDGRKFIEDVCINKVVAHTKLTTNCQSGSCTAATGNLHLILNLPASAVEFLGGFSDCLDVLELPVKVHEDIFVHCYCFSKEEDPLEDCKRQVAVVLGERYSDGLRPRFVRRVAPNKVMVCVTFNLIWITSDALCSCSLQKSNKRSIGDLQELDREEQGRAVKRTPKN